MSIFDKLSQLKSLNQSEADPVELPDGTSVILGTLSGKQDRQIIASVADFLGTPEYGHAIKLETLSHAVREVRPSQSEPLNLREVEFIPNGDVFEGEEVLLPKHVVVREIVESWPDIVVDTLFLKWSQLVESETTLLNKIAKVELMDSSLRVRIEGLDEELHALVRDAVRRNLDVDARLISYVMGRDLSEESSESASSDPLIEAIKSRQLTEEEPQPIRRG